MPTRVAVRVSCTRAAGTSNSSTMRGSAGRYMSMAKAPTLVITPSSATSRRPSQPLSRIRTAGSRSASRRGSRRARPPAPRSGWSPRRGGCVRSRRGSAHADAADAHPASAARPLRRVPSGSHGGDQPVHPLVVGPERVLAQHRALGLVVELEVYPVDGEVTTALLRVPDELAAQPGPGGLRRGLLGLEDLHVVGHPVDRAPLLQQGIEAAAAT